MGDKNQIASSNDGQPNNETNPLSTDDDMNNSEQVNKAPKSNPKNLKYNSYYYIFIFSALLSLGCISGILFYADGLLSKTLRQVQASSYIGNLVSKIESGIVALNSDSRNFILTNDARYFENYKRRGVVIISDIKLILNDPEAEKIRDTAIVINESLEKHFTQIKGISAIQKLLNSGSDTSLIYNVRNNQKQLENELKNIGSKRNYNEIILINSRLKSNIMALSQNPILGSMYFDSEIFILLEKLIESSQLTEKKKLLRIKQTLKTSIIQLYQTNSQLIKKINGFDKLIAFMGPSLDKLINYSNNNSLSARQNSEIVSTRIRKLLIISSIVVILLFTFVGLIMIWSIIKPIKKISSVAIGLADGDYSQIIPDLNQSSIASNLSRTLIIFKENMKRADRLRKDLEIIQKDRIRIEGPKHLDNHIKENEIANNLNSQKSNNTMAIQKFEAASSNLEFEINKSAITKMSDQLTLTSKNATEAAEDAERTELITAGLSEIIVKVEESENLMTYISDQMSLLTVQTALIDPDNDSEKTEDTNTLNNFDEILESRNNKTGQTINVRTAAIQNRIKKVSKIIQGIGVTVSNISEIANEFSTNASEEALKAANNLLNDSEELRSMLDDLLENVENKK
ncbi:MAG: methyl-accepting chemotaxis protein [Rhodospirillales bacterium]|nr:methyl-accepting chemotaxis protein [Rhodospirillales bacterium]